MIPAIGEPQDALTDGTITVSDLLGATGIAGFWAWYRRQDHTHPPARHDGIDSPA